MSGVWKSRSAIAAANVLNEQIAAARANAAAIVNSNDEGEAPTTYYLAVAGDTWSLLADLHAPKSDEYIIEKYQRSDPMVFEPVNESYFPLIHAASFGRLLLLNYLLEAEWRGRGFINCGVRKSETVCLTPLYYAKRSLRGAQDAGNLEKEANCLEVVRLLESHGARLQSHKAH